MTPPNAPHAIVLAGHDLAHLVTHPLGNGGSDRRHESSRVVFGPSLFAEVLSTAPAKFDVHPGESFQLATSLPLPIYGAARFPHGTSGSRVRLKQARPQLFNDSLLEESLRSRIRIPKVVPTAPFVAGLYFNAAFPFAKETSWEEAFRTLINQPSAKAVVLQLALDVEHPDDLKHSGGGASALDGLLDLIAAKSINRPTIGITSLPALLRARVPLRSDGDWERRARGVVEWMREQGSQTSAFARLARFPYFVVRLSTRMALIVSNETGNSKGTIPRQIVRLCYHSTMDNYAVRRGHMIGFTELITCAILRDLAAQSSFESDLAPSIARSVDVGLRWCQELDERALGEDLGQLKFEGWILPKQPELVSPDAAPCLTVDSEDLLRDGWSITGEVVRQLGAKITPSSGADAPPDLASPEHMRRAAVTIATTIVESGVDKARQIHRFPVTVFEKATVVDHREFQQYSELRAAMARYLDDDMENPSPLCLAVFGRPGGGKSFGVKQLAQSMKHRRMYDTPIEANVSQFKDLKDLARVFHLARDVALSAKVPLIMLDEFDCSLGETPFGWLRYYLMPMQDGRFQDGEFSFRLGKAILVFVGGINHSYEALAGRLSNEAFILAKGPDFVSRLRGYLNTQGVARDTKDDPRNERSNEYRMILRRAVLIRQWFEKYHGARLSDGKRVSCDARLLESLLTVDDYCHGTRSLEAIISMLRVPEGTSHFDKRSLPARDQLEMHVSVRAFELAGLKHVPE